ncbi:ATP-dependent DNA helicase II subunit 2 [Dionaea muscipula]
MARNKEGLILLLDVGPTMHTILPEVEKFCSLLIQKKLIYNKSDEVGVVLFGTEDTNNELTREIGGYEHIVVLQDIKVVNGNLVDLLKQIPRGTVSGDYLDAIVVGMDMLIKKYGHTIKGKKRLCLITNALCPIREPNEGTKEDQVRIIASQMTTLGMKLECIVVRGEQSDDTTLKIVEEDDHLLDIFSKETRGKIVYVESSTSLLGAVRTRNIAPVTIFRGDLELSPKLKIKVWVYKKTSEERFPTLKKYSDKAPPTDKFATHEVKVDYEYKRADNPREVVPPEQRIKGYRYGPHVVPISTAEWEAVKFNPEKGVTLLGFTDASNILRHYYMKDVNIFIAEPGNKGACLAVSALARAMKETNKVAILRCVWRQGQGNVVVGLLTPNVSDRDNVPDCFYFNVLPFAEDVREFQFPSFRKLPAAWQPSDKQQDAADNLVKILDLASPGKKEMLQPELTPNPVLQRFFRFLELKSKNPDASVPPLDETLKRITEPDSELLDQNKHAIDEFVKCFKVKENPKIKKKAKRWREKPYGSDEEKDMEASASDVEKLKASTATESTVTEIDKIGDSTPVQDFEVLISRRESPDWVNKAIKQMRNKILDLVEDSYKGDNYNKALECLVAFRKGCVLEQEPKEFNDFLNYLSKYCLKNEQSDFCELLASQGIKLITKTEAVDSEVTDKEAESFLDVKELKMED